MKTENDMTVTVQELLDNPEILKLHWTIVMLEQVASPDRENLLLEFYKELLKSHIVELRNLRGVS